MALSDSVDFCVGDITSRYSQIDPAVEGIVDRISSIGKQLSRDFDETLARHGISHSDYVTLLRLRTRSQDGRMSAGDLSRLLSLSTGAMTNRLDRLEKAGFVRRVADARDRRAVLVQLTDAGVARLDGAISDQTDKEKASVGSLSRRELETLNNLLRKVLSGLESRDEAATA